MVHALGEQIMALAAGCFSRIGGHASSAPALLDPDDTRRRPQPPEELRPLHHPELFEEARARLLWHIRRPVAAVIPPVV